MEQTASLNYFSHNGCFDSSCLYHSYYCKLAETNTLRFLLNCSNQVRGRGMIFTKKAAGLHAIRLLLNSDSFKAGNTSWEAVPCAIK